MWIASVSSVTRILPKNGQKHEGWRHNININQRI